MYLQLNPALGIYCYGDDFATEDDKPIACNAFLKKTIGSNRPGLNSNKIVLSPSYLQQKVQGEQIVSGIATTAITFIALIMSLLIVHYTFRTES